MIGGGYKKDQDYYYFCDCIVKMTDDYYEDSHGNKIIGSYNKLKFVFSGFNSVVRISENVNLHSSSFYIHSDAEIEIGDDVMCSHTVCFWSSDGHSIFDVRTGMNISSTEAISKNRKIVIGDHVWIGSNAIILYNTEIREKYHRCRKLGKKQDSK